MILCYHCGKEAPKDNIYCGQCATKLVIDDATKAPYSSPSYSYSGPCNCPTDCMDMPRHTSDCKYYK